MLDKKFWLNYFKVYDILNYAIPYQELIQDLIAELQIKKDELILDAGCGTGNVATNLKRKGVKVIYLDKSLECLNICKEKDRERIALLHDLTQTLPFKSECFDKIVSSNTIYLIANQFRETVFKEFFRVLKDGGTIVVSNPIIGFSPLKIYLDHIKKDTVKSGWKKTSKNIIKMIKPTVLMFYYNFQIKRISGKSKYNYFEIDEQKDLLTETGFTNISNKYVYSQQCILTNAKKS
jgi:ubiquinone/menaquinone biosynthesis C-methylase UbiE